MNKDDATRKKYLSKIQKLMRLANNTSSPEEAANAISKAQAFMREHGISDTEVTYSEICSSSSKSAPSHAVTMPKYMTLLAATIEKAFAVKCIFSWRLTERLTRKRVVSFYGQDGRDVVAAYAFDVLSRQLAAARKEFQQTHLNGRFRKNAVAIADRFCEGWAVGAYQAVSELVLSESQSKQMKAYTDHIEANGVTAAKTRKAKENSASRMAGHMGYLEGSNARVHHGVSTDYQAPAAIGIKADGGFDA